MRIVQPVFCINRMATWMIERGIAGDCTDSHNACLPRLPFTKYDDRYAAAFTACCGFTLRSTNPNPYCGASSTNRSKYARARHLSSRPVCEHRMDVQYPASLNLPYARYQEHRPAPEPFHCVLIRPPVKPSPPTRSLTVPTSSCPLLYTTSELPRVLVLPQARAHPLIPRQTPSTRSRDRTQQDVSRQNLQVAEKLLALIGRPHMAVLGTAPTAAHIPPSVQRATTATAAPNDSTNGIRRSPKPTRPATRPSGARMFASR